MKHQNAAEEAAWLLQLSEGERAALFPVILREYNPDYPRLFAAERDKLMQLAGGVAVRIRHIGSTAVLGLISKPTVDILLEIKPETDIKAFIAALPPDEYICLTGEALTMPTPPPHLMILKGYTKKGFAKDVFHIHVRYVGDWDEPRFCEYLATHPKATAEYAALKRELSERYKFDRDGYTAAKGAFICAVTARARAERGAVKSASVPLIDTTVLFCAVL